MERTNPETSHLAHESVSGKMLQNHWTKILNALSVLKLATYEELADHIGFKDKNQVSRRLKVLEDEQLVYKPGTKKLTKSNRWAFQYSLSMANVVPQSFKLPTEKYVKGKQSAADIACSLIAKTKQGRQNQMDLFNND